MRRWNAKLLLSLRDEKQTVFMKAAQVENKIKQV